MPTITVDGQKIETGEGRTILEVAREAGRYVPTLCYHPKVGQAGLCRLCVVEVEGARTLVTACNAVVTDNMVVHTASPSVMEARRMIVELLLADGEHDCLTCEQCGDCELQEVAYQLGIKERSFQPMGEPLACDTSHRMIQRNPNKCINCFRCIRGCNDVVVNEVLEMGYRGARSLVIADQDVPLGESTCVGCGECIQLCPTGALTDTKSAGRGRAWDLDQVRTTCPYCGVGCQMDLHVHRPTNRVVRVTGTEGNPPNDGMLCVKGRFAYDFPANEKRLSQPLIKKDGRQVPVSWDEALDYTAQRLNAIREADGPDALAAISCGRDTNENNYATMKFMRAVVGTNNVDHCART
jgi:formate dehydrogenase major subunit